MNIVIAIDDVCPKEGYRITNEKTGDWLQEINETFGAKFTLFIPSNYHGQFPISHHLGWVDSLLSVPYFELAAHGHLHDTTDRSKYGECEFAILDKLNAKIRLEALFIEWMSTGHIPKGWRSPGWLTHPDCSSLIGDNFFYVAAHNEHSRGVDWGKSKVFYGHDGIHQENVTVYPGNVVMFQSHIAGKHNHNVWNEENFEHLKESLKFFTDTYDCKFYTLQDLYETQILSI